MPEQREKNPHTKLKIKMTEVSASNLGGRKTMVPSGLKTAFSVCTALLVTINLDGVPIS